MSKPFFSVITTGKYEKDEKALHETFENWIVTKRGFEKKRGMPKAIEFIVVDAGENGQFPTIPDSKVISLAEYEEYKEKLMHTGIIQYRWWDTPAIGRNLGFEHATGQIVIFHDIDSLFSTGTHHDDAYTIHELDKYDNYFEVMYHAFRKKDVVAAVPSLRPRDCITLGRRFGIMGLNLLTRISLTVPTISINDIPMIGASVPGCSLALQHTIAQMMCTNGIGPYDSELGVSEDQKISRLIAKFGRITYEKRAGVFTRTENRVSNGFDIIKAIGYAIKGATYFMFPGVFKYHRHVLTI